MAMKTATKLKIYLTKFVKHVLLKITLVFILFRRLNMFSRFPALTRNFHASSKFRYRNSKRGSFSIEDELGEFLTQSKTAGKSVAIANSNSYFLALCR
jgi:hypothetical protein